MDEIFLPTLHTFENKNVFTGSLGLLRYRIVPTVVMHDAKTVNNAESFMTAQFWHGRLCWEKSEMEGEETFPMTEEGKEAMRAWLWENR